MAVLISQTDLCLGPGLSCPGLSLNTNRKMWRYPRPASESSHAGEKSFWNGWVIPALAVSSMPQTSFHYQQLVPYICCVDLLVAFPSYRDVCSLFIPYWDSLVCTFLQAPLLYLNCSTFSPSGPGTWLPEAPANSTPQLK